MARGYTRTDGQAKDSAWWRPARLELDLVTLDLPGAKAHLAHHVDVALGADADDVWGEHVVWLRYLNHRPGAAARHSVVDEHVRGRVRDHVQAGRAVAKLVRDHVR